MAQVALPDYGIARVVTGQYDASGSLWEGAARGGSGVRVRGGRGGIGVRGRTRDEAAQAAQQAHGRSAVAAASDGGVPDAVVGVRAPRRSPAGDAVRCVIAASIASPGP